MAYELPSINVRGRTIKTLHPSLPGEQRTALTASVVAAGLTLTVLDSQGFSQDVGNQYVVVGKFGEERTEIVRITAVPTATSITVTALGYDHPVDTPVTLFQWNQIEIGRRSTSGGATTAIATIAIQPDQDATTYINTGTEDNFYVARFNNAQTATFSSYSDSATPTGYGVTTVWAAKNSALRMTHQKIDQLITDDFLNREVENCERDVWFRRRRWSWAYTFDSILGDTSEGKYSYALPSNIADSNTNAAILGVHIWTRRYLEYVDKDTFQKLYENVRHTTLAANVGLADVTISLTDSSDFDTSGSIRIGSDTIAYTGNNKTTNVLSGVTGIDATHTSADDVWQNQAFGEPLRFTVFGGNLLVWYPPDSTWAGRNVYLDFYRTPGTVNSDGNSLSIPDPTIYHHYLAYKILVHKADGAISDAAASQLQLFEKKVLQLERKERTGQRNVWKPKVRVISPRLDQDTIRATNTT